MRKTKRDCLSEKYSTFVKKMKFHHVNDLQEYHFRLCGALSYFADNSNNKNVKPVENDKSFPREI